jgi:hypothetical protein
MNLKFRVITLLLAVSLGLQCIWLVSSQLARPAIAGLPTDAAAAAAATKERDRAALAAEIGAVRGDLWAQSAFTYANLLFGENEQSDVPIKLARARVNLDRALRNSPIQPAAWLLRAELGVRYPNLGFNTTEALKMSYFTGPSDDELLPLRLRLAAQSGTMSDPELQPLIRRDLRILLTRKRQAVIASIYSGLSPSGKHFIEQALGEIDRPAAEALRAGTQKPFLPD